jgi:pantoate--beta-alanine ligase
MQVIETTEGFRKALEAQRTSGRPIGLVPTMGFLHAGHLSLMERAAVECGTVAVTIFVNPLQFGAGEDLSSYPRDLDRDQELAAEAGADFLFVPAVAEMYPDRMLTTVSVAEVSDGLEGSCRPTHFAGVATVVAKLFNIAGPCRAYFGEKDWQQLAVVRRMVQDLSYPVEVVGCPIVREPDGLAMSSRNARLTPADRQAASVVSRALFTGRAAIETGVGPAEVRRLVASTIAAEPRADLDYAEVVQEGTGWRLLAAARFGTVRLIDNVGAAH